MESLICRLLFFTLIAHHVSSADQHTVFRSRQRASVLLLRSRRANAFLLEEILQGNLERECFEERCNKEEARECFENDQKTNEFWTKYYDGDQCHSNPCKHGGTCRDGIGGYTCTCAEMYSGTDCQTDKSQCPSAGPLACEHFCKPMTGSFRCFCARGYTLNSDGRSCSPHVQNPCGSTETPSFCPDGHCSWEVKFVNTSGDVVCHGVVLGRKSVLTSATCMSALKDPHVTLVGRHSTVALRVSSWTPHKRYVSGAEDDLAFLELMEPFPQNTSIIPLCLPERDYSENILMRAGRKGVVMGGAGHSYLSLDDCHGSLNLTFLMTNKMFCMQNRESDVSIRTKPMPCDLKSGSPVASVEGKTAFLTGISLSTGDCNHGLVFTKLSRYLHWLRPLLHASEKDQQQQL
ncbi:protein Z, vitamin K-dependent plasma glycoprotein b isoform X1 [Sinocyclocheilus grahami]|uniref:protein Z, vitamin K-dependent plasma glycoprotein b isoform X1 n=1 Tax=Sinocyclocheilus grahami TaxID=75366 RepID=UPI0007ACB03B|nr:PREDICTED: vitamin K-dependent protein Z-like isoform X1 [Sinocyclocheilus grahami]